MSTFERILRQAEAAKRKKLSSPDLEQGFEWWRKSKIWEEIGEYEHRPVEFEALVTLQEHLGNKAEIMHVERVKRGLVVYA